MKDKNNKQIEVDQMLKSKRGTEYSYRVDSIHGSHYNIRNVYNGRSLILSKEELVKRYEV